MRPFNRSERAWLAAAPRGLATVACVLALAAQVYALPNITKVVETGGDNEATDTIPAKFTGQTFVTGVANEPVPGKAASAPYTAVRFGEEVPAFVDRNHQWTGASPTVLLPRYLVGGEYILSGNDNRDNADYQLDITISKDSYVYFLVDNRLGDGDGNNAPNFDANMNWLIEQGYVGVTNGINRAASRARPDEIGVDEGADGAGPGVGVNQWSSIYVKREAAGTFSVFQPDNGGRNMYGIVIVEVPETPTILSSSGNLLGVAFEVTDGSKTAVNVSGVKLTFDGVTVTPQVLSKSGTTTTVKYSVAEPLASGSTHTAVLTVPDTGGTVTTLTETLTYTVAPYATLTAATHAAPAGSVDTASSGFTARVVQARDNARWPGADLPNTTQRAEDQLAGRLTDPDDGQPMQNFAEAGPGPSGTYNPTVINWNQERTPVGNNTDAGNFTTASVPSFTDDGIPGIPGNDPESASNTDNIAAEIVGYLELKAGVHLLGVNSDDGFRVTAASNPRAPGATELGVFVGGRGSADSLFYVRVMEDGIYPVRLIWYEGGGGAMVEFFSVDQATNQKILINDRNNPAGIKSYARAAGAARPYIAVSPLGGATGVDPAAVINIRMFDQAASVVTSSIKLEVNGTPVTVSPTKSGTVTTVTYDPPGLLASDATTTVRLTWSDNGTPAVTTVDEWSFTALNYSALPFIPASFAVASGSVDLNSSGFNVGTYQMPVGRAGFADNNSSAAAEAQWARRLIDPATGQPYENLAFDGVNPDGTHPLELINWEQGAAASGGFTTANAYPETEIPGIAAGAPDNIVSEIITYVELKAGLYQFGINSDDGFKLTTAPNPRDALALQLGLFDTGRGAADSIVSFVVAQDGIYPMRLLWWEGGGGAALEWFLVSPQTGARVLLNDRFKAFGAKAYNTYTGAPRPLAKSASPAPGATGVFPDSPIQVTVSNLGGAPVQLLINGTAVVPELSTSGSDTTIRYTPTALYGPGSTNTVSLNAGPIATAWRFTVQNYPTLPASLALPGSAGADTDAGFRVKVVQARSDAALANFTTRAEEQLAGTLIDPATSAPYTNEAIPGSGPNGTHVVTGIVNWNQDAATADIGNFIEPAFPDAPIPGIPGSGGHTDNLAAEVLAWVQLPAGLVKLGVNSDDGFRVTVATNADPAAIELGVFDGGRGAADTQFSALVTQAGLYPLRLVWYEGTGGANLEFFSVDAAGQKIPINHRANAGAFKAYHRVTAVQAKPPTISSVAVAGGNVTLTWTDGTGPFKVQSTPAIGGAWTDETTVSGRTASVPLKAGETKAFYRVVDSGGTP